MDYVCIVPPDSNYSLRESGYQFDGRKYYNWNGSFTDYMGYWGGLSTALFFTPDVPGVTSRPGMDSSYDVTVLCACVRGSNHGCFAEGTMITLADGSAKRAEDIVKDDMVLNPATGKPARIIHVIDSPEEHPLIALSYGSGILRVTQTHPMLTHSGLKKANELSLSDEIQGADGAFHKLTSIAELPIEAGQYVINFEMEADSEAEAEHMLLADGIVTGDMILQLKLSQK